MVNGKEYTKYIFVILLIFVTYLAYLVVKPFVAAILTSAILAYMFYPFYVRVNKKIKRKNISAFIVSILIILIIAVPFFFVLNSLTKESQVVYIRAKQIFTTGDIFSIGCAPDAEGTVCSVSNWVGDFLRRPKVRYNLEESIQKITASITQRASAIIFSIPSILLNIFVTFFTTFYLFRDGKAIMEKVKGLLPLKLHHQKQMFQQLDETTYAIIYGSLLVAFVQGAVGALGFYIFKVPSPITWGIMMAIFALLPFIGTAIVWLPVSLIIIVQGFSMNSQSTVMRGLGLLIYSALIVASIDNVIKPYIIGKKGGMHPVLVLLGVLGGLAFFGFVGFIIGPLILAIFVTLLEIYEKETKASMGLKS